MLSNKLSHTIVAIAILAAGCAGYPHVEELEDGRDVKITPIHVPFFPKLVVYRKSEVEQGSLAATSETLSSRGDLFIVGGAIAMAAAIGVHVGFGSRVTQGLCLAILAFGVSVFVMGLFMCLISDPWILGGIMVCFVLGLIAIGYWLFKTKDNSILKKGQQK